MKTAQEMLTEARRQRDEIQQYFADVAHWNTQVRKPHEPPIEPDPDGVLMRLLVKLNSIVGEISAPSPKNASPETTELPPPRWAENPATPILLD